MKIAIGTKNRAKVEAVKEVLKDYQFLRGASVNSLASPSEIAEQPLSLDEMIQGAKNRAKNAFEATPNSSYSFGIESGLFEVPGTRTGYLESCICSVFDGVEHYIGLSCGFEVPAVILDLVLNKKMDLNQACNYSGVTNNEHLGAADGIIGLLTKRRLTRMKYTKQCISMALIQLENASLYLDGKVEQLDGV